MNQPDKPKSSKQMWLWALLALFMLMSVGIAIVAVKLISKAGVGGKVSSFNSSAITPVNLAAHYDPSSSWNGASAWEVVPHGAAALGGVPFTVDGLLRLSGSGDSAKSYRQKVEGIAVGKKFGRLHLLHLTGATGPADLPYARVVLHYTDGSTASFPLIYGTHARYWHRSKYEYPSALSDPNSKVVWRGTHESTDKTLRLFKTTFENPKPDLDVTTIDLVSENVAANAVILAMSVGPSNLPKAKDDPASLPEPEEPFEGEIKFTAVDAKDGKRVANVKLKISGTETSGSFRTPDAVTDAKGEIVLKHPGDSTRTMTVVASGDGIAMKTIRWGQRAGEIIPSEYTFRADKAVLIGGIVQDEAGQPVRDVKITITALGNPRVATPTDQLPFSQTILTNDSKGRWEFRSLPKGFAAFNIQVSHPDYIESRYLSDGADSVYAGDRIKMATLLKTDAVFSLRKGLAVTGKVLNEKGEPIIGAKLLLGDSRFVSKPNQGRTDERGEFRLPGATAGSTYLTVQANGYAPESRQITVDGKTEPVAFKLAAGNVFKAKVIDELGSPVRDARITINMWENRQTLDLNGKTDSRGRVTITSMPASGMSGSIYKVGYMNMGGVQFVADGEEHTFTLRKGVTITGTVVDADTKESIERFDVTRGQLSGGNWNSYNIIKGSNGAFSFKLDQQYITAMQIDSDAHLPAVISLETNGETHFNIELKKGTGPKGIVQMADGQPAAGAQIGVLVKNRMLNVGAGKISFYGGNEPKVATANSDGTFTLRFYPNAEKIIATHLSGYAETSFSNFVSGGTIALQPWGSIKGVLKIGTRLGTNETILLSSDGNLQFNFEEFRQVTDDQGNFAMKTVPPGDRRLVRLIPIGDRSWGHSHMQSVTVKAGEVTTVTMGGNGRTVIGKLALSDPSRVVDWRQSGHHSLSWYPKPPPYRTMDEYRAWESLPETIAARKNQRSYTLIMHEDGTFRVDDVLAGSYSMSVRVTEPRNAQALQNGMQNTIGTLNTNVTVPEIPDAPAAPPLDIGTIEVPLVRTPQRNAALR
jgi:protocatechuate 3,4-dioxygenase beta subunit